MDTARLNPFDVAMAPRRRYNRLLMAAFMRFGADPLRWDPFRVRVAERAAREERRSNNRQTASK